MSGDRTTIPWVADAQGEGKGEGASRTSNDKATDCRRCGGKGCVVCHDRATRAKTAREPDTSGRVGSQGPPSDTNDPANLEPLRDPAINALRELLIQDRDKRTRFKAAELVLRHLKDSGGLEDALIDILGRD